MFLPMLDLGKAKTTFLRLSFHMGSTFNLASTTHMNPGTKWTEWNQCLCSKLERSLFLQWKQCQGPSFWHKVRVLRGRA